MGKAKVVNRLPQFVATQELKGQQAITAVLLIGGSHAATYTPQNTSNLVNSQIHSVRKLPGRVVGTLAYTAEYALAVHEAEGKLKGQPRPKVNGRSQGVFWGPGGEPQFLKRGFEESAPLIQDYLYKAMKV